MKRIAALMLIAFFTIALPTGSNAFCGVPTCTYNGTHCDVVDPTCPCQYLQRDNYICQDSDGNYYFENRIGGCCLCA